MKQQINLYSLADTPRQDWLNSQGLLRLLLLSLAALLLVSGISWWQNRHLVAEVARLQAAGLSQSASLEQLQAKVAERGQSPLLQAEIARLRSELERRRPLLEQAKALQSGNLSGFSPVLAALARQAEGGLWLRRIELAEAGRKLTLEGSAKSAELLPGYLQRLAAEEVFAGRVFAQLQLSGLESGGEQVDFILGDVPPKEAQ
jgi:MSHA biogenesis protein MshI